VTRAHLDLPERPRFATLKTFPRALRLYPPGNEAVRAWGNIEGEKEGGGNEEDRNQVEEQVRRTMDRYCLHAFLGNGPTKCLWP